MVSFSYWVAFAWGLAITFSFVGWGVAAARVAGVAEEDCEWALCACWGMAVVIALGGALALCGLANRAALVSIGVIGCGLGAVWFRPRKWGWGGAFILGLALLLWYAPSVASRAAEPYDDYLAYFTFARRFLDTGTLMEPFSFRRLLSYGGQSLLHALTIAVGSEKGMNMLDSGIAMILLGGLIFGSLRGFSKQLWAVLGTVAVLLVPILRNNTMSQATGLVLWIALFRTVQRRSMVLAGLLLAALCSLRGSYVVAVVLLTVALLISTLYREGVRGAAGWWRMVAAACAAIVPWCLLSYRSSGTPIYPLFKGYQAAGMGSSYQTTWLNQAQSLFRSLSDPSILFLLVPLLVTTFLLRGEHVPFCAAALALGLAIPLAAPLTDTRTLFRYMQPLGLGSLLVGAYALRRAPRMAAILACMMAPLWVFYAATAVSQRISALRSLPAQIADRQPAFPRERIAEYQRLESVLPAGASVYALLPLPSLLNYRTHRIFNADWIGIASLPPGMPFFRGPQALKTYLLAEGIEYIAYNDFDHPAVETGYWRGWWREHVIGVKRDIEPLVPYVLDVMSSVDRLAATEGTIYRAGDLA
ncbi:MAG: hypothetical protein M3O20_13050, partial [Acidobacteriota bacterium]|nr:hypothetical protein [Acidobacteriota bacterium]